jgi:hypothetical protein
MAQSEPEESTLSERTPLIAPEPEVQHHESNEASVGKPQGHDTERAQEDASSRNEEAPLPMGQMFVLCYARLVEPVAFFSIFPFVNKMIFDTGNIKEADVGFYSGLIVSFPTATQQCR